MRIALFIPTLGGGGAERVTLELARGLCGLGCDVDLVVVAAAGHLVGEIPPQVRLVELGGGSVFGAVPRLARYLRTERPNAIISALDYANIGAILARLTSLTRVPLVVVNHIHLSTAIRYNRSLRGRALPLAIRLLYRMADAVVAVSVEAGEDLARISHMPVSSVRVIYNPVITPELFELARRPARHPWIEDESIRVVLSVGRLTQQKNPESLIHAFSRLEADASVRLLILGDGPDRGQLQALVERLGLIGRVELVGFVSNPLAFMARCAVFVLPSRWEALPTVLIEALACGAKVISTDCSSGPREILEGGRFGRLVPVNDASALKDAIAGALAEPGSVSRPDLERYTVAAGAREYLELVRQLDRAAR